MSRGFQLFGSLSKVEDQDDGSIMVYGVASSGAKDASGETVLPDAMKAALPEYGIYPALREMHGLSAAGRTVEASVDDDGLTRIVAHVVDPIAVAKVKTKTYAGFSIGGKVLERDKSDRTIITKLKLNEISLVDRPCNPEAAIDLWKADGALENDAMAVAPTNDEVKVEAEALAKAAGKDGKWKDFVVKAREALVARGSETEVSADDAVDDVEKAADDTVDVDAEAASSEAVVEEADDAEKTAQSDPVAALTEALDKAAGAGQEPSEPVAKAYVTEGLENAGRALATIAKSAEIDPLAKGLYTVGRLAEVMSELAWIQRSTSWEAADEGDNSPVPQELATAIQSLGATLVAMAREEVAELLAEMTSNGVDLVIVDEDGAIVELASGYVDLVKADADLMEKAGARNSKADQAKLQSMHDNTVALGAKCAGDGAAKASEGEDLHKAQDEISRLTKAIADAAPQIEGLAKRLDEQAAVNADLKKRLEQVENEPAKPRAAGSARVVQKADDVTGQDAASKPAQITKADTEAYLASLSDEERAMLLTKAALRLPMAG